MAFRLGYRNEITAQFMRLSAVKSRTITLGSLIWASLSKVARAKLSIVGRRLLVRVHFFKKNRNIKFDINFYLKSQEIVLYKLMIL